MATKMATMSKGPRTLGRIPGAIRSESSSPGLAGAPTVEVVVAISPPWVAVLPYCLPCHDDCVKAQITGARFWSAGHEGLSAAAQREVRRAGRRVMLALGAKGVGVRGGVCPVGWTWRV